MRCSPISQAIACLPTARLPRHHAATLDRRQVRWSAPLRRYRTRTRVSGIDFKTVLRESAAAPQDGAAPAPASVRGARKAYGKMVALNNVDVTVTPGQLPRSWPQRSGKTTLLNAISGLARLDRGEIRIGTVDPDSRDRHTISAYEFVNASDAARLRGHVDLGQSAHRRGLPGAGQRSSWLLQSP